MASRPRPDPPPPPAPPREEQLPPAPSHLGPVRKRPPRCIVLHATAGTDSRAWLTRTSFPNKVSIHVLISKDGAIYRSTPPERVAWHAGLGYLGVYKPGGIHGSVNDISLGIELENLNNGKDPYPLEQVEACGFVIAGWWRDYGPLPVLPHALIDGRKSDPAGFDWAALYRAIYRWWDK